MSHLAQRTWEHRHRTLTDQRRHRRQLFPLPMRQRAYLPLPPPELRLPRRAPGLLSALAVMFANGRILDRHQLACHRNGEFARSQTRDELDRPPQKIKPESNPTRRPPQSLRGCVNREPMTINQPTYRLGLLDRGEIPTRDVFRSRRQPLRLIPSLSQKARHRIQAAPLTGEQPSMPIHDSVTSRLRNHSEWL